MNETNPASQYPLGNTEAEHARLARQAAHFDPLTERLFREAGIGPGFRVLDLGSGAGDVAMLAARLVGPSGEVVGLERDPRSIAFAAGRVAKAGMSNVSFTQTDVTQIPTGRPFDAAVGRFILMFLPNPASVLRSVARLVRPGGAVAFHEVSWDLALRLAARTPVYSAALSLLHATFRRAGANTEMGFALRAVFHEAGLKTPAMRMDTMLGRDRELARWIADTLQSVRTQIPPRDPTLETLGDFATLQDRIEAEFSQSDITPGWISIIGAWTTI